MRSPGAWLLCTQNKFTLALTVQCRIGRVVCRIVAYIHTRIEEATAHSDSCLKHSALIGLLRERELTPHTMTMSNTVCTVVF